MKMKHLKLKKKSATFFLAIEKDYVLCLACASSPFSVFFHQQFLGSTDESDLNGLNVDFEV